MQRDLIVWAFGRVVAKKDKDTLRGREHTEDILQEESSSDTKAPGEA